MQSTTPIDGTKLSLESQSSSRTSVILSRPAESTSEQKNADKLFNNFVFHTQGVDVNSLEDRTISHVEGSKFLDGEKPLAVKHLRTLLTLVLTDFEVRKPLSNFTLIGRDLLSIGAFKAVGKIALPSSRPKAS